MIETQNIKTIGKLKEYVYYYIKKELRRRLYCVPVQPGTAAQQQIWQKFREGVADWQELSKEEKKIWNEKAYRKKIEGFNLFMREFLK